MENSLSVTRMFDRSNPPSVTDMRALLADAHKTTSELDLRDFVLIIATTGIRPGELSNLKWSDVDFGRRCLRLRSKKLAGNRLVPFGPRVLEWLVDRHEKFPDINHVLGSHPENTLRRVSRQMRTATAAAWGGRATLHSLRHFFFKQWMTLGGRPETLARVAGCSLSRFLPVKFVGNQEWDPAAAVIQEQIEKLIAD